MDDVVFIALEDGAGRRVVDVQRHPVMNGEFGVLGPFLRAGTLGGLFFLRPFLLGRWRGRLEATGLNLWSGLLPFQYGDLVAQLQNGLFELLVPVQQLSNDGQQRLDQGRPLLGTDFGKLHLHACQCINSLADQLRIFPVSSQSF